MAKVGQQRVFDTEALTRLLQIKVLSGLQADMAHIQTGAPSFGTGQPATQQATEGVLGAGRSSRRPGGRKVLVLGPRPTRGQKFDNLPPQTVNL